MRVKTSTSVAGSSAVAGWRAGVLERTSMYSIARFTVSSLRLEKYPKPDQPSAPICSDALRGSSSSPFRRALRKESWQLLWHLDRRERCPRVVLLQTSTE